MDRIKQRIWSIVLIFFLVCFGIKAQQEAQYTNYMYNVQSYNPGYVGSTSKASATHLTRLQWVGLEGAPRTTTFSFQSPLPYQKMGLGFSVVSDEVGPVRNLYVHADYAYHLPVSEVYKIAFGISGGFYNYHVQLDQVPINSASVMGQNDIAFSNAYQNTFQPNVGLGLYLYGDRLTIGISSPKLLSTDLSTSTDQLAGLRQHYFFIANYIFTLSDRVNLKPGIIEKVVPSSSPSTDITLQIAYNSMFMLGASYRVGDAIAGLLAVQATPQWLIGYSYDYTTSDLADYNNGSHELFLTYSFAFPKKNPCHVEPLFRTYQRKQHIVKNPKPKNRAASRR